MGSSINVGAGPNEMDGDGDPQADTAVYAPIDHVAGLPDIHEQTPGADAAADSQTTHGFHPRKLMRITSTISTGLSSRR